MIDERTELLINRRLDGEITDDESHELNKRLIRSPEARALFDTYQSQDTAVVRALDQLCYPPAAPHDARKAPGSPSWGSRLGIGIRAVAAALLLATMSGLPSYWSGSSRQPGGSTIEPVTAGFVAKTPQLSDVPQIEGPREETHQVHRNVVGVWDEETQSVYILEMDQNARKIVPFSANF